MAIPMFQSTVVPIRRLTPQPTDRGSADCPSQNGGVTKKDFIGCAVLSTPLFLLKGEVSNHKGIFDEPTGLFPRIAQSLHRLTRHVLRPGHLLAEDRQEVKKFQSGCAWCPSPERRSVPARLIQGRCPKRTRSGSVSKLNLI